MAFPNQNLFSLDRKKFREKFNSLILFEGRGKVMNTIHNEYFTSGEITYDNFTSQCTEVCGGEYNFIDINMFKEKIMAK